MLARGTILALSESASNVAVNVSGKRRHKLTLIEELQERYVKAQSQIMLFEVTAQEQGVELYQMFSEQLYLEKNKDALSDQMSNLREVASIRSERIARDSDNKLNLVMLILTVLTTLEIIVEVEQKLKIDLVFALVIVIICMLPVVYNLERRKQADGVEYDE